METYHATRLMFCEATERGLHNHMLGAYEAIREKYRTCSGTSVDTACVTMQESVAAGEWSTK